VMGLTSAMLEQIEVVCSARIGDERYRHLLSRLRL
jgi:hypothetical protein